MVLLFGSVWLFVVVGRIVDELVAIGVSHISDESRKQIEGGKKYYKIALDLKKICFYLLLINGRGKRCNDVSNSYAIVLLRLYS